MVPPTEMRRTEAGQKQWLALDDRKGRRTSSSSIHDWPGLRAVFIKGRRWQARMRSPAVAARHHRGQARAPPHLLPRNPPPPLLARPSCSRSGSSSPSSSICRPPRCPPPTTTPRSCSPTCCCRAACAPRAGAVMMMRRRRGFPASASSGGSGGEDTPYSEAEHKISGTHAGVMSASTTTSSHGRLTLRLRLQ